MKVNKVVKQETLYIGIAGVVLSLLMQAVFLVFRWWNLTVLLGNLFGFGISLLNFFLMALTVQIAVEQSPEDAKRTMKQSQTKRIFLLILAMAVVCLVDCFNIWAGLIPFLFPRIAVGLRMFGKKNTETSIPSATSATEEVKDEE